MNEHDDRTIRLRVDAADPQVLVELWHAACGEPLTISPRSMAYNLRPSTGVEQQVCTALVDDRPAGFVMVSRKPDDEQIIPAHIGWCNALAVAPSVQRRGVGSRLLAWAEEWLRDRGCSHLILGGSIRPFVPGLPVELDSEPFFHRRGYRPHSDGDHAIWDVAANLAEYATPAGIAEIDGKVQPAAPADQQALLAFFDREFAGRWRYEYREFLRDHGRISDFMVLWTAQGINGFCRLTFADSIRPVEGFYPYALPQPWGQLGPIGVSAAGRGHGYGAALLDAGLRRLHDNGVNGCIIDWTDLTDFYAKFGFAKHRQYKELVKAL